MGGRGQIGLLAAAAALLLVACGGTEANVPDARNQPRPSETLIEPDPPQRLEAPQHHPNVLVIEADDMRWDDVRWMPNVRRLLQRRGLSFENSFAPYPLCCPSRASFLTGRYAHNHGVLSHVEPFGFASFRDRRTIATVLQKAGYRTALVGKYLNGYGEQTMRNGQSSLDYVPPGWTRWRAGSDHVWGAIDPFNGGTYSYFNLIENVDGELKSFAGRYSTDVMAQQTRSLISRFGSRPDPWFIWWTPVAPHHGSPTESDDPGPTRRTDGLWSSWLTPARPDWVKGRFDSQITHGAGTPPNGSAEKNTKDKPRYLRKLPELTPGERDALTEVTRQRAESLFVLDVQIGRTISRLSRSGQLANTVIMFTSDNGLYLGEHRKRLGKINLHEPSLRVPLIVAGPGVPRGRRYDPVSTVDLAPTLAAYAGVRMPRADGVDLAPLIEQGDRGWDRPVVTEAMMTEGRYAGPGPDGSQLNTRGLRLGRWKITRYATGETELYDLATDPLELQNLSRVPRYADELRDLRKLYRTYRDCRGDACAADLPKKYRVSPAEMQRITLNMRRATRLWFGG
jgi:arylsulfatase A-like enzyme